METVDQVVLRMRVEGAAQAASQVDRVRASTEQAGRSGRAFGQALDTTRIGLIDLSLASNTALYALGAFAAALAGFSGIAKAAEFQGIAVQLRNVTGSARDANRVLGEMKTLGKLTPFDAAELSRFSVLLLNTGTSMASLNREMQAIVDLAAFTTLPRHEMDWLFRNLAQIRGRDTPAVRELYEMAQRGFPLGRIISSGLGDSRPMTNIQAFERLQGMDGPAAYETLIKGAEAMAAGAASAAALKNPMYALSNLFETLNYIMEPTGKILLTILMPALTALQGVANVFETLNRVTGGTAGLAAMTVGLVKAKTLLIGSFRSAILHVNQLAAAISRLATVSGVASGSQIASLYAIGAATGRQPMGIGGRILGGLKTPMGIGIAGVALGGVANAVGTAVGGTTGSAIGSIGDVLGSMGGGAMLGGAIGSILPGIGTALGSAIGAALAGGLAIWDRVGGKPLAADELSGAAHEQKEAARALKDAARQIGGGEIASRLRTDLEFEVALRRATSTGVG